MSGPHAYWLFSLLFLLPASLSAAQPDSAVSFPTPVALHAAPDEASAVIATAQAGEPLSPVAESSAGGSARWYLVRSADAVIGWIRDTDGEVSKKLQRFFRPLHIESLPIETRPPRATPPSQDPAGAIRVPVRVTGGSVIVPVTLNRRLQTHLVLDTAASMTMISRRLAKQLELKSDGLRVVAATANGTVTMATARLASLRVAEAEAHDLTVTIHDVAAPGIDGLLGLDFLRRFRFSIDAQNQLLLLFSR